MFQFGGLGRDEHVFECGYKSCGFAVFLMDLDFIISD